MKLLTILVFFNLFTSSLLANTKIQENAVKNYTIHENNTVSFEYDITLSVPQGYTTAISYYNIELPFKDVDIDSIQFGNTNLSVEEESDNSKTKLSIALNERILNFNNPIRIKISGTINDSLMYETPYTKTLNIPTKIGSLQPRQINIRHPKSFGNLSSPSQNWDIEESNEFFVLKSKDVPRLINLVWGEKALYDFEISKKFVSSANDPTRGVEVTIPKPHNSQQILISQITPTPKSAYQDYEGNIFLSYHLEPNTEINVNIKGQISLQFDRLKQTLNPFEIPLLTKNEGYWKLDEDYELNRFRIHLARNGIQEDDISKMDLNTRQAFYKFAYEYVSNRLELRSLKNTSMESDLRLGVNNALIQKDNAAPEDYVDLLTTIYREYTVPTKMIEGYVFLDNAFFHSWLEYWDQETGWNMVDPALTSYTQQDYFNSNFLSHIVIMTRGYNYLNPKLTFFAGEEFVVNLGESPIKENISLQTNVNLKPLKKDKNVLYGDLEISNMGNTIISLKNIQTHENIELGLYNNLQIILPNQSLTIPFTYLDEEYADELWIKYTTLDGKEVNNVLNIEESQNIFWWWDLLVTVVTLIVIWVIIYIIYLISKIGFKWIKNYYQ